LPAEVALSTAARAEAAAFVSTAACTEAAAFLSAAACAESAALLSAAACAESAAFLSTTACTEAVVRAGLRLAACLAALDVLPCGRAVARAAQRVVAIDVLRARANVAGVRTAMLNALQTLARAAAEILTSAVLQRLLRLCA
jgi:hypothetical protein